LHIFYLTEKVHTGFLQGEIKPGTEVWLSVQQQNDAKIVRISKTALNSVPLNFSSNEEVEEFEENDESTTPFEDKRPSFF